MKAVDVRRQDHEDRRDRAQSLDALHHVAATELLDKFVEEAKRQLLGDHVRHEKRAPLRFADLVQLRGQFCLYLRPREIAGKLFPERDVCGFGEIENLSGQNTLHDEFRFLLQRELRRSTALHETREHFLQQRPTGAELFVETVLDETRDGVVKAVRQN